MRIGLVLSAVALLLTGLGLVVIAGPPGPIRTPAEQARQVGELVKNALAGTTDTALYVDGQPISETTLRVYEAPSIAAGKGAREARDQAVKALTERIAMSQLIAENNVVVSDQEVDALVAQWRAREQQSPATNAARDAYLQSIGQTEDQYWASEVVRGPARQTVARNKLLEVLLPGSDPRLALDLLDRLIRERVAKMVVTNAR